MQKAWAPGPARRGEGRLPTPLTVPMGKSLPARASASRGAGLAALQVSVAVLKGPEQLQCQVNSFIPTHRYRPIPTS